MLTAPPPIPACPVCGTASANNELCPHCKSSGDWTEQVQAVDFVVRRLQEWHQAGRLTDRQLHSLTEGYARDRQIMVESSQAGRPFARHPSMPPDDICWSCKAPFDGKPAYCRDCGAAARPPGRQVGARWPLPPPRAGRPRAKRLHHAAAVARDRGRGQGPARRPQGQARAARPRRHAGRGARPRRRRRRPAAVPDGSHPRPAQHPDAARRRRRPARARPRHLAGQPRPVRQPRLRRRPARRRQRRPHCRRLGADPLHPLPARRQGPDAARLPRPAAQPVVLPVPRPRHARPPPLGRGPRLLRVYAASALGCATRCSSTSSSPASR